MVTSNPGPSQPGPRPSSPWVGIAQGVTIRTLSTLLADLLRDAWRTWRDADFPLPFIG